ncbi:MAG: PA14 domain-containing protein [Chloroflexi bacterium]|nr:PA14 domain-containing protein [Chloroflexota bacterium]
MDNAARPRLRLIFGLTALALAAVAESILSRHQLTPDAGWLFLFGAAALVMVHPDGRTNTPSRSLPWWVIGGSIALGLGGLAGFFLSEMDYLSRAALIGGLGIAAAGLAAAWLLAEWEAAAATARAIIGQVRVAWQRGRVSPPLGIMLAGTGLVAIASVYWLQDGWNHDPLVNDAAFLWLAGIGVFSAGVWRWKSAADEGAPFRFERLDWLLVGAILIVAAAFRSYQLADVPYGSWYDESESGLEALEILKGKPFSPAGALTPFNPVLFFYMIAAAFKVFGVGMLPIRLVVATMGVLCPVALYLLVRLVFDRRTAAIAGFMVAVSSWHVDFSRFGLPNVLSTPIEPLAFFFLVRGYQTRQPRHFLLAGLTFGVGMYSHTAFRLVLMMAALLIAHWLASDRRFLGNYLPHLAVLALSTLLVVAPLTIFGVQHSEEINRRLSQTWIFVGKNTQKAKLEALQNGVTKHLLMFNYQGDPNGRHGRPGAPVVDFAAGALMVLGLGYSLYHWRRWPHFLLAGWFFLGLSAGMFTIDWEAPQAARTVIMIPAVYVLAALPLAMVWRAADAALPRLGRAAPALVVAGVLGYSTYANYNLYFNQQMKLNEVWVAYSGPETAEARLINQLGDGYRYYFGSPDAPIVQLITHRGQQPNDYRFFNPFDNLPLREKLGKDLVYIFEPWRVSIPLSEFLRYYPNAKTGEVSDLNGQVVFYYAIVKREDVERIQGLNATFTADGQPPLTRVDPAVNFDWATANPLQGKPFRAEWSGTVFIPNAGQYRFTLESAGAGSLEVAGQRVLTADKPGLVEGRTYLPKGQQTIRLQDSTVDGKGRTVLSWTLPSGQKEVVPQVLLNTLPLPANGLTARYYAGPDWQGEPRLVSRDQSVQFRWHPAPLDGAWSVEWRGQIEIPEAGEYGFATRTNERAWLSIDGQPVIDNAPGHTAKQVNLTQGRHKIVIRYKSTIGYSEMRLSWTPPGKGETPVPGEVLFPEE